MKKRPGTTFRISPETMAAIHDLAQRNGYSDTDFLRWGVSLTKLVLEEQEQGNTLILINEQGQPLSKVILPKLDSTLVDSTVDEILREPYSLSLERAIADLDPDLQP